MDCLHVTHTSASRQLNRPSYFVLFRKDENSRLISQEYSLSTYFEQDDSYVGLQVFTAVIMKKAVFWDVAPSDSHKTDVSQERVTSIFW
jgi:hypothetical protein